MGSTVVRGEVEGTVEFTGAETFFGKTASLLVVRKYVRVFLCVFVATCSRLSIFLICCVCVRRGIWTQWRWWWLVVRRACMSEYWSNRTLTLYSLRHSLIISGCVTAVQFACSFSFLSVETSDSLITTLCRMETKVLLAFYHVPLMVCMLSLTLPNHIMRVSGIMKTVSTWPWHADNNELRTNLNSAGHQRILQFAENIDQNHHSISGDIKRALLHRVHLFMRFRHISGGSAILHSRSDGRFHSDGHWDCHHYYSCSGLEGTI